MADTGDLALQLRTRGSSYASIARVLGLEDEAQARDLVEAQLSARITERPEARQALAGATLDALLDAVQPLAAAGSTQAAALVLEIWDRKLAQPMPSIVAEPLDVRPGDVEGWADALGGWFEEAYRTMRSFGYRPRPAFICAWLSCSRDDRGTLQRVSALADFLGIARQSVYKIIARNKLREWAEQLRMFHLRGDGLGEIDARTYTAAAAPDSSAADRKLYYERAGVMKQDIRVGMLQEETALTDWLKELRGAAPDGEANGPDDEAWLDEE